MKITHYFYFLMAIAFFSCAENNPKTGEPLDTVVTGKLRIMVDEGYKPVIETSIDVFDSIYRQATIEPIYTSEAIAINALIRDSIQVIVVSRKLNDEELEYFKKRGFTPPMTPVAHEGVAFIVNPANKDTVLTVEQIKNMLTGKMTKWTDINAKNGSGSVQLVFDNPLSGTVRYCKDSIAGGANMPANASALQTNEEVINYVGKHKNAIGIISSNWISDTDDKGVQRFLKAVQLVDVAPAAGEEGYGPYQAYLQLGKYPFKRTIYIINAQARKGLGLGFASFLAGSDGQRIMMKDGLLPAQIQPRLIQVRKE
jgi:phosphate transport system substrate-binding protein